MGNPFTGVLGKVLDIYSTSRIPYADVYRGSIHQKDERGCRETVWHKFFPIPYLESLLKNWMKRYLTGETAPWRKSIPT